ncbi:MAG: 50S ribosomal protein L5 [DPANN group archaeon]|nr:50S ribosomal protein L5 [DPANN group archaeon]
MPITQTKTVSENKMRQIKLEKITLNIGAGTEADNVEKAVLLLQKISGLKAVKTSATKRIPTWKVRPGLPVGAKVTIRGKKASELLKNLLHAIDNEISQKAFAQNGFSFGLKEYIEIPGVKYDPKIGIIGLEVAVSLMRPGYRVAKRKLRQAKVAKSHIVTAEESLKWAQENFGVKLKEED